MSHTCCECNHSIANISSSLSQLSRVSILFHAVLCTTHNTFIKQMGPLGFFSPPQTLSSSPGSHNINQPVLTNKVSGPHSRGQTLHYAHMYGELRSLNLPYLSHYEKLSILFKEIILLNLLKFIK